MLFSLARVFVRIAVVHDDNLIRVVKYDSRLFNRVENPQAVSNKLVEFVRDQPVKEIKEGLLVRPRVNTEIGYRSTFSCSFSTGSVSGFGVPLMIVGTKRDKVVVAGTIDSDLIKDIGVNSDLICEYGL